MRAPLQKIEKGPVDRLAAFKRDHDRDEKFHAGSGKNFSVWISCCSSGISQDHEKQDQTDLFYVLQVGLAKKISRRGHLKFFRRGPIARLANFKRDRDRDEKFSRQGPVKIFPINR
jgi:hypothetical protein